MSAYPPKHRQTIIDAFCPSNCIGNKAAVAKIEPSETNKNEKQIVFICSTLWDLIVLQ